MAVKMKKLLGFSLSLLVCIALTSGAREINKEEVNEDDFDEFEFDFEDEEQEEGGMKDPFTLVTLAVFNCSS